ncbi:DUF1753-domain-containing protein [Athelia psychrophila]|uniref:DUF1753-domain-containing protein n=1 Tax=Athelia psychrophila TaxID=1759441 RepID=A0A166QT51_9AGAM|nr:DUF1753-domain-containing protein [Fibularhizoctonia sp. CBS 109695]
MLKPEWRIWPLSSFLGRLDLKTGVTVSLMFALLNTVAGVYGLIAGVMGAGGSFAQLSLYLYSVIALGGLIWGLRITREVRVPFPVSHTEQEDARHMLYFAHLFFVDHVLSAEQITQDGAGGGPNTNMTEAQRTAAAHLIWDTEKGTAAAVISLLWLTKIYFAMLIYSYAVHLRKGSYRSLPSTRFAEAAAASAAPAYENSVLPDDEDELDDFYRVPLRSPDSAMCGEEGPRCDVIAEMDGGQSKLFGECYRGAHCAANEHARDIAATKEFVVDSSDATPTTEDEI